MGSPLVILGKPSPDDGRIIASVARSLELDIHQADGISALSAHAAGGLPVGYLSFLPSSRDTIINLFSSIPVGAGQDIPFYQAIASVEIPAEIAELPISGAFRTPLEPVQMHAIISGMVRQTSLLVQNFSLVREVARYRKERNQLVRLGTSLSSEQYLDKLLELILAETRDIVDADAGSIYVREHTPTGDIWTNRLLFKVAQNDSVNITEKTRDVPIPITENTISGYVALMGEPLTITDVYVLDDSVPYKWSKGFDRRFKYRTKSMLTVPLKNLNGEVVGVLQLMNKKKDPKRKLTSLKAVEENVIPFPHSDEDFVRSIAAFAAVSIERVQLYQEIENIFEGFLSSSAAAIDERDRVTSGHSLRVAQYAMAYIDAINEETQGPFGAIRFSEERKRQFKFAAYLHDIGKIGVPEAILTKEGKLSESEMSALLAHAEYITAEVADHAGESKTSWATTAEVESDLEFVKKVNASGFLSDEDHARLMAIKEKTFLDSKGIEHRFLSEKEWLHLSIRRGNLTEKEREIINSHAVSTRRILSKIPWTRDLKDIPYVASHHHEKLDGSGYPDGLKNGEISLECRILAVVDIYEALVSQDRPYKPRMPAAKAVDILRTEAKAGRLDTEIVEFFVAKGLHTKFLNNPE
jgi:HD-GYP domain-containing protein (c-di-GMP phosphodiesterase class II)